MKDKRLEEQFKGYFEGVTTPELPNDIVADAKKSVKRRDTRLPRFAKIASIAASFVLVFAVAAVLIARADFSVNAPDGSADGSLGGSAALPTYGVSELRYDEENAYALSSVDGNLKFIEKLAYLNNADVQRVYTSRFADEDTAHDTICKYSSSSRIRRSSRLKLMRTARRERTAEFLTVSRKRLPKTANP